MILNSIFIIIGFILLLIGANLLVKGSTNIATKFHIPEILIGLTIVALGTSAPELIITITSAQIGSSDLILGNAIGSNLCNILLILGLIALIHPIQLDKDTKKFHIPIALFSAIILLILQIPIYSSSAYVIEKLDGAILLILFILYFSYPIFIELKDIIKTYKENKSKKQNINILLSIFFILLGAILLKFGGDFVVDYSVKIAEYFKISERVIGLTIIAIGTATPELVTSIMAVIKKDSDLAIGNLIGSCTLNLLLIIGIGAIITPLNFTFELNQNLILLIFSTALIFLFNFIDKKNTITRTKGCILLIIFSIYIVNLFF